MMDLTLIVPVRGRQENIAQKIDFFADLDCHKIIADSSDNKYEGDLGTFSYRYFGPILYYEKMYVLLDDLETTYYVECPDDDFIMKQSIQGCYNFISNSRDNYVWADGLLCDVYGGHVMLNYAKPYEIINKPYSNRLNKQYYAEDPMTRIQNELNCDFIEPNHGVLHAHSAKDLWKLLLDNESLMPLRYHAKIFALVMACHGNHKTLPVLYHLKNGGVRLIDNAQKFNLESQLQCHMTINSLAQYDKCKIIAEYIFMHHGMRRRIDIEETITFLIELISTYGKIEMKETDGPDHECPIEWPQYNEEKALIASYY